MSIDGRVDDLYWNYSQSIESRYAISRWLLVVKESHFDRAQSMINRSSAVDVDRVDLSKFFFRVVQWWWRHWRARDKVWKIFELTWKFPVTRWRVIYAFWRAHISRVLKTVYRGRIKGLWTPQIYMCQLPWTYNSKSNWTICFLLIAQTFAEQLWSRFHSWFGPLRESHKLAVSKVSVSLVSISIKCINMSIMKRFHIDHVR